MNKYKIVAEYFGSRHEHLIEAKSEAHALNILYGRLGSRNRLTRNRIHIIEVK